MKAVESADCVVIITNHSQYDYETIFKKAKAVMDARNALGKIAGDDPKVTGL